MTHAFRGPQLSLWFLPSSPGHSYQMPTAPIDTSWYMIHAMYMTHDILGPSRDHLIPSDQEMTVELLSRISQLLLITVSLSVTHAP